MDDRLIGWETRVIFRNVSWLTNAIQWQSDKHFRCVRRSRLVSPCAIAEALDAWIATRCTKCRVRINTAAFRFKGGKIKRGNKFWTRIISSSAPPFFTRFLGNGVSLCTDTTSASTLEKFKCALYFSRARGGNRRWCQVQCLSSSLLRASNTVARPPFYSN